MPREIPLAFATRSDDRSTSSAAALGGGVQLADETKLWALTATVLAAIELMLLAVLVPSLTLTRFPPLASMALLRIGAVVSTPEKDRIPPTEPEVELKLHV